MIAFEILPDVCDIWAAAARARAFAGLSCDETGWGGLSGASIKLADTRDRALCDAHAKVFEEEDDPSRRSFFSEIISSIADVKFSLVPFAARFRQFLLR